MTANLVQTLGLKKIATNLQAEGVGRAKSAPIKPYVNLRMKTNDVTTPIIEARAYVMAKVTGHTRSCKAKWESDGRLLADPKY